MASATLSLRVAAALVASLAMAGCDSSDPHASSVARKPAFIAFAAPTPTPAPVETGTLRGEAFLKLDRSLEPLGGLAIKLYEPGVSGRLVEQADEARRWNEQKAALTERLKAFKEAETEQNAVAYWQGQAQAFRTEKARFDSAGFEDYALVDPVTNGRVVLSWSRNRAASLAAFDRVISSCQGQARFAEVRRDTRLRPHDVRSNRLEEARRETVRALDELESQGARPFADQWAAALKQSKAQVTIVANSTGEFAQEGIAPGSYEMVASYHDEPSKTAVYWLMPLQVVAGENPPLVLTQSNAHTVTPFTPAPNASGNRLALEMSVTAR